MPHLDLPHTPHLRRLPASTTPTDAFLHSFYFLSFFYFVLNTATPDDLIVYDEPRRPLTKPTVRQSIETDDAHKNKPLRHATSTRPATRRSVGTDRSPSRDLSPILTSTHPSVGPDGSPSDLSPILPSATPSHLSSNNPLSANNSPLFQYLIRYSAAPAAVRVTRRSQQIAQCHADTTGGDSTTGHSATIELHPTTNITTAQAPADVVDVEPQQPVQDNTATRLLGLLETINARFAELSERLDRVESRPT
ncbi:hypothetical protein BO79DRAFT_283899 [Aspergillus costaricaensis CBS 115574]|uniref:Uncharacterized protein n=1 Tax=Aspergillus costaricaensis CBS 115574 TaxID=1448317 RepID=A0ACD1IVI7_9EURO|nr:hypothetical protein BO79DRAFT_283899 [Aspergillus costaricaensis CBS 115574]RAK94652.1 hypothetical protein BO79DRAFT_283899 [Aspergillus costaricaensis CBS 115574]